MVKVEQSNIAFVESNNVSWHVKEHRILNDLSFSVSKGEFVGIIGPNGAGKTTTQRVLLVCTGNTCRSPMAAGLLGNLLAAKLGVAASELESAGWSVASAGTYAGPDLPHPQ